MFRARLILTRSGGTSFHHPSATPAAIRTDSLWKTPPTSTIPKISDLLIEGLKFRLRHRSGGSFSKVSLRQKAKTVYVNANSIYSRELLLVKDSQNRRDDLGEGAEHFPGIAFE
jgi:hypothetical protein